MEEEYPWKYLNFCCLSLTKSPSSLNPKEWFNVLSLDLNDLLCVLGLGMLWIGKSPLLLQLSQQFCIWKLDWFKAHLGAAIGLFLIGRLFLFYLFFCKQIGRVGVSL